MYRTLENQEIKELELRGCTAEDWANVEFKNFDAARFFNVQFRGWVKIGEQSSVVELSEGIEVASGLRDVVLHNCTVGNDVYISGVKQYISNYTIEDNVIISGVDSISAATGATFGNGVRVSVLNEAGGREVVIYNELSSQIAYIFALYRENHALITALEAMVNHYTEEVTSKGAYIGYGTVVCNCGEIRDVNIGAGARIEGVAKLKDGSINSTLDAPSYVGRNVIAEHFIILSATKVSDGVLIDKCFVGQGCELGKQFSAENSLFFSNCIAMHGEACATFAGPYTVTHHKSSLLIGGMFSFMNAGSGSNQSNHMYKFGPVHQGIVERGSKLASDSYILWPMRIGAFSLVIGKHYSNSDTSTLPFSYIIEKDYGEPTIVPAANLRSVGTVRDVEKWPRRDKRGHSVKLDLINFKLLTPYTVSKMLMGKDLLEGMMNLGGQSTTEYVYGGCKMKRQYVERGICYYEAGVDKFIGGALLHRLSDSKWDSLSELKAALKSTSEVGLGQWCDISGAILPKSEVDRIVSEVASGKISKVEELMEAFHNVDDNFDTYSWAWASNLLQERLGCTIDDLTTDCLSAYMDKYLEAVKAIDLSVYEDSRKEFSKRVRTGFGVDGSTKEQEADFEAVRGRFEDNDFALGVLEHLERKTERIQLLKDKFATL